MRKSINRTTVIIVLAVFLTMSVGYALFSDTITIEGTATAQGNFDITATCQTGYGEDFINVGFYESANEGQSGYTNDICIVSDDTIVASVELKQPGSGRAFTFKIKNTGSIDAYLKLDSRLKGPAVLDENFITTELTNLLTGEVTSRNYNLYFAKETDTDNTKFYIYEFPQFKGFRFGIKLADGRYTDGIGTLDGKLLEEALYYVDSNGKYYLKLSPNDSLIGAGLIEWDKDAFTQGYSSKTTFRIPFDFVQKTSDMMLDPNANPCLMGC